MKTIWNYLVIAFKAVCQFLRYAYAPELTIGVVAVIIYLAGHKFWGVALFIWGVLLLINELKQKKTGVL
jgi:membrane-bound ClpP family serine protease